MQDLNITIVQPNPAWQKIDENLHYFSKLFDKVNPVTDIIILPEMFTTGFTMDSRAMAEPMLGRTHQWMQEKAQKLNVVICGSIIISEEGHFYNRFLWVEPDGNTSHYDKRHLFRMADEHHFYTAGKKQVTIDYQGWKFMPLICYDLRFPVWARNQVNDGHFAYDIMLYVANWPQARINAWDTLLSARAVENFAYCVGVNRYGNDEKGIVYNGHSAAYDAKGQQLFFSESEGLYLITLEKKSLDIYREQFPAFLDADSFNLE